VKTFLVVKMAGRALRRNVMRTMLTTLGIVIGVGSVITMMEIGNGATRAIQKTLASIGANTLAIIPGAQNVGGINYGIGSQTTLTPKDAEAIGRQCPAVANVAPLVRARTQIVYGNRNWVPTTIYGTDPAFLQVRDWTDMAEGTAFSDQDVRNMSKVCLVGGTIVRELFGGVSPIGKEIRIRNVAFKVVGVLSPKGANMMGQDQDDTLLAPWTTIKYRVVATSLSNGNQSALNTNNTSEVNSLTNAYPNVTSSTNSETLYPTQSTNELADVPQPIRFANVDQILTNARSAEEIPYAIEQITDVLRETHHLRPGTLNDFTVRDMTEITQAMSSTTELITKLLLYVAMISLVVGGVGIMNIMLVSVTERTREIGLRMAVGAEPHDILRQFLTEAIALCLLGGIMGILAGRGASILVSRLLKWPTAPSLSAIVTAVLVSASVGVIFGFYPAWKGSRLDPIDALRYE
jgi:ABC-type antimicrobial peptide transport system permease subunit